MSRQDPSVRAFLAEDAEAFRHRHPDVRRPTVARVILARHPGRCVECGRGFLAGDAIRWAPGDTRHADCERVARDFVDQVDTLLDAVARAGGERR